MPTVGTESAYARALGADHACMHNMHAHYGRTLGMLALRAMCDMRALCMPKCLDHVLQSQRLIFQSFSSPDIVCCFSVESKGQELLVCLLCPKVDAILYLCSRSEPFVFLFGPNADYLICLIPNVDVSTVYYANCCFGSCLRGPGVPFSKLFQPKTCSIDRRPGHTCMHNMQVVHACMRASILLMPCMLRLPRMRCTYNMPCMLCTLCMLL